MSLPFPTTGYVTSVVPLDCWIQITTEVVTATKRYCAVILIGNTNYKIRSGDVVTWGENREIFWIPDFEMDLDDPESWKKREKKRLWLTRVLSQQSYAL
jgi:hypothetical protein